MANFFTCYTTRKSNFLTPMSGHVRLSYARISRDASNVSTRRRDFSSNAFDNALKTTAANTRHGYCRSSSGYENLTVSSAG